MFCYLEFIIPTNLLIDRMKPVLPDNKKVMSKYFLENIPMYENVMSS